VVRLVRSGLGGCQQAGAVIAGWCLLRLSTLPRLPAPLGPGRRQATGECTCLQCPPTTPTARFSLVGGWGGLKSMCFHVWHLLQYHHTTSILVTDHSETWRLRLSLPACSPRLLQPLPPPNHPLAHNSPCHELGQVLVTFNLFGLLAGSFSLGVGLL